MLTVPTVPIALMQRTPKIRRGLIAGPDPEQPSRYLIFCTQTGDHFELPAHGWRLARALDGKTSIDALIERATKLTGHDIEPSAVRDFVVALEGMGLFKDVKPPPVPLEDHGPMWTASKPSSALSLHVHPEARYECGLAGTCCESGYVIPLTSKEVARVRAVAPLILNSKEDPVCLLPTRSEQPWTFALSNEWSCPFLSEERKCLLHETDAHPATCKVFPFGFVRFGDRVHVSVTHRCVCGALDKGPLMSAQETGLKHRLLAAKNIPALLKTTQVDDLVELPTGAVVPRLVSASSDFSDPWGMLMRAAGAVRSIMPWQQNARPKAKKLFAKLSLAQIDPGDLILSALVEGRAHPNEPTILKDMKRAGLLEPYADVTDEAGRFIRDYLFGLRIYRFSSLADGFLGAALALQSVLSAKDHADARVRIMHWEEALRSPGLRALLGRSGPLAKERRTLASVHYVIAQLKRRDPYSKKSRAP